MSCDCSAFLYLRRSKHPYIDVLGAKCQEGTFSGMDIVEDGSELSAGTSSLQLNNLVCHLFQLSHIQCDCVCD